MSTQNIFALATEAEENREACELRSMCRGLAAENVNGSCVSRENLLHIIRVDSINKYTYIFVECNMGDRFMIARRVF